MSITQYGNNSLLIPLLGNRPFICGIAMIAEQTLQIKGALHLVNLRKA